MSDTFPVSNHHKESARLVALASYDVLDTAPDAHFDTLVRLASRLCRCPMGILTLVDSNRQWFKAEVGLGLRETPRQIAFCAHTIEGKSMLQVSDTWLDPRFAANPLVVEEPKLRFYAGVPLLVEGGHAIGTLAVLDRVPRRLSEEERSDLEALAEQAVLVLEERRLRRVAEAAQDQTRRDSESLYAIAGRVAQLGAWELDVIRRKVVWSDVVADIHAMPRGFSPDLDNALSFYLEPGRSTLARAVEACLETGTPFDYELVLQPAQGSAPRWVRSIGEAVRDQDGRITHLRGACQDITERRSHMLQIERLADRLSSTLESIPDPFLAVGPDGRIELVNAALEHFVSSTRADLIGKPVVDVLHEGVMEAPFLARCREAIASQQRTEFEALAVQGRHRFDVRLYPTDGGLTIHARDITQREKMLEQLRLLDACVRCLNDAVMITDAEVDLPGPTIVFANQAAERLCGWTAEELVGGSPRRLQGPLTQRDRLDALRAAITGAQSFETELINYHRTGESYWVELKLSSILDNAGKCTHFVAIERDITERKLAEAHREALEQRLRQAQKMESIGTLAGGIAHDFNNILGSILGSTPLIEDELPAGGRGRSALATISSSAQRARSLVQQILAFASQQAIQRETQRVRPLVEEAVVLLRSMLPAKVSLLTSFPARDVFVECDRNQIQQVLINLCTNAWQSLPAGGGRVTVGLDAADGMRAHLWVSDNGCGIEPDAQLRIFEPFFTTKPVGQGTGLGLPAAHGIVTAHGGTLSVVSEPGVGSVFHIYLPACDGAGPPSAAGDARPHVTSLDGLRVLCVDDDPVMLTTMQALLEREGCSVDAHLEGSEALDLVQAAPRTFDLLVTDYNMPLMDGLTLVQQVRRAAPHLPVILASGFLSDTLRDRAKSLGVNALMQKERTVEDLVRLVHQSLEAQFAQARDAAGA